MRAARRRLGALVGLTAAVVILAISDDRDAAPAAQASAPASTGGIRYDGGPDRRDGGPVKGTRGPGR